MTQIYGWLNINYSIWLLYLQVFDVKMQRRLAIMLRNLLQHWYPFYRLTKAFEIDADSLSSTDGNQTLTKHSSSCKWIALYLGKEKGV